MDTHSEQRPMDDDAQGEARQESPEAIQNPEISEVTASHVDVLADIVRRVAVPQPLGKLTYEPCSN